MQISQVRVFSSICCLEGSQEDPVYQLRLSGPPKTSPTIRSNFSPSRSGLRENAEPRHRLTQHSGNHNQTLILINTALPSALRVPNPELRALLFHSECIFWTRSIETRLFSGQQSACLGLFDQTAVRRMRMLLKRF